MSEIALLCFYRVSWFCYAGLHLRSHSECLFDLVPSSETDSLQAAQFLSVSNALQFRSSEGRILSTKSGPFALACH